MKTDEMISNQYNMSKPREVDLFASLEKTVGLQKAQTILREARASCSSNNHGDALISLKEIAVCLSKQKGIISIVGRSMIIRIIAYTSISRERI